MKNLLTKTLLIGGIAGLSLGLCKEVKGQIEIDSMKYCVFGTNKDSIIEIAYFKSSNTNKNQNKTIFKNKEGYYKVISTEDSKDPFVLKTEKQLNEFKEKHFNELKLFLYAEEWSSPGIYIYNKGGNLIRKQIYK